MKTSGISLGVFKAPLLCLFWLTKQAVDSVMLSAPEVVTGTYGGSVTVACQYNTAYRDYTKYWCKGEVYELCHIVVKTPKMRHSDRTSIVDDKEAGVFTVTVTFLEESDKDLYWCVIARHGRNINTSVRLRVSQPVMTTTANPPLHQTETSWWATMRWILFIIMLCCLVVTHIAVWRIKAARRVRLEQQVQRVHYENIYERHD